MGRAGPICQRCVEQRQDFIGTPRELNIEQFAFLRDPDRKLPMPALGMKLGDRPGVTQRRHRIGRRYRADVRERTTPGRNQQHGIADGLIAV